MEGLEKFREAFEAYSENYVIIGGTACDIAMTGTTVRPRATHDIDMIVIVEKMTADFAEHLWRFVREGGYRPEKRKQHGQKKNCRNPSCTILPDAMPQVCRKPS